MLLRRDIDQNVGQDSTLSVQNMVSNTAISDDMVHASPVTALTAAVSPARIDLFTPFPLSSNHPRMTPLTYR